MTKNHLEMNFEESLPIGRKKELYVKNYFKNSFDKIEENDDNQYDLALYKKNKRICIEIKFDDMFLKTGNFAIEFQSRYKPSGIKTTKAHYWLFVDSNNNLYIIKTSKLKNICIGKREIQPRCQDSFNKIYLVPKNEFINNSISIDEFIKLI